MKCNRYFSFFLGLATGGVVVFAVSFNFYNQTPSPERLIAQYYASEVATLVSPHSIRERMTHDITNFVLVDTRTQADYEREHIVGAINIDSSQPLADVLRAFKALPQNKDIIIYCYSSACMNGRKVGHFLAQNGIFVQEMTIGWNEWRYGWETWNYDTEWDEHKVEDYVFSGQEPGTVPESVKSLKPCPIDGSLGC